MTTKVESKKGTKIAPLGENVLVRRDDAKDKTDGGIVLPDSSKEKPLRGKVIAVGTGRVEKDGTVIPLQLKVGDHVVFTIHGHAEIVIEGTELLLVKESNVFAVLGGE